MNRFVSRNAFALFSVIATTTMSLGQLTRRVPADYPTIQAAINANIFQNNGEVILLADGVHTGPGNRGVVFPGLSLSVRSESGDPGACIIDCEGAARFGTFGAGSHTTIQDVTIRNGNSASASGGAALVNVGANSLFRNCVFEGCISAASGGAIMLINATLSLDDCQFRGNQAQRGGGVYAQGHTIAVQGCTFDDNYATSAGGGMRVTGGSLFTCTDSIFHANRAWIGGGGLFVQTLHPDSAVARCVFRNNVAALSEDGVGGGFICDTGQGLRELSDCIFEGNVAEQGGGAVFRGASTTRVERSLFLNNRAQEFPIGLSSGGGVQIETNTLPAFVGCRFIGNSATYGGGSLVTGTPTFTSCLFAHNRATGPSENHPASGAMDVYGVAASSVVRNCTFAGNTADEIGGAITVSDSGQLDLANCVMWGNMAPSGAEIRIGWGTLVNGEVTVSYCDIAGGQAGISIVGSGTLNWGAENIDIDPQFVDVDGTDNVPGNLDDDFRLQLISPCADAGNPNFQPAPCEHDLSVACRLWDGDGDTVARVDMGAYELEAPRGDVDGTCAVGLSDLTILLSSFGAASGAHYVDGDLDGDGDVDLNDLTWLLGSFGATCP